METKLVIAIIAIILVILAIVLLMITRSKPDNDKNMKEGWWHGPRWWGWGHPGWRRWWW